MSFLKGLPLLAAMIAGTWIAGCVLLAGLMALPSLRLKVRALWPLMASEALIIAVGCGLWFLPKPALGAALVLGAMRVGYENGHVHGLVLRQSLAWPFACMFGVVAAVAWFWSVPGAFLAASGFGAFVNLAVQGDDAGRAWLRAICYPLMPIAAFVSAASSEDNAFIILLAFFLVELFDSFSVLGGRLFGRTKLAPVLSPKKTWEGLGLGLIATVFVSLIFAQIFGLAFLQTALIAITAAAAALLGDLAASASKRRANIKDYPAVLQIQGGLLDITDAWIVAAPLTVLAAEILHFSI